MRTQAEFAVAVLTDDELETLHSVVWEEINVRTKRHYVEGKYPSVNQAEIKMVRDGHKIDAIQAYRKRVGFINNLRGVPEMGLARAKCIVEYASSFKPDEECPKCPEARDKGIGCVCGAPLRFQQGG